MDRANQRNLLRMAGPNAGKVRLMRSFDPTAPEGAEVPDPYHGGPQEFREVAEMLERAVGGLLDEAAALRERGYEPTRDYPDPAGEA